MSYCLLACYRLLCAKKQIKMKRFLMIIVIFFFISACEKIMDIPLGHNKPELVVNSLIMPDSVFTVYIGRTQDLSQSFQNGIKKEKNVICSLFVNNSFREILQQEDNKYISSTNLHPQSNNLYLLKIYDPKLGFAQGKAIIPEKTYLSNVSLKIDNYSAPVGDFQPEIYSTVYFTINDNKNTNNYYEVYITQYTKNYHWGVHDTLFWEDASIYIFTDNKTLDAVETGASVLFSDSSFNGEKKNLAFHIQLRSNLVDSIKYIRNMKIHLRTVTKEYLEYKESLLDSYSTVYTGNFSPVSFFSNIDKGLGIFLGYSEDVDSTTFPLSLDTAVFNHQKYFK